MTRPPSVHHSLLRPCILHILRAAGYHSTRPSVLDALSDLAARYMALLAQSTATHAAINEHELEITVQEARMAMQDCGALIPEKVLEGQEFDGEEDMRGVDNFLAWVMGPENREIRRIAMDGSEASNEDYLIVLKKKHSTTDEDSRYNGTIIGRPVGPRQVKVEGADISSIRDWAEKLKTTSQVTSAISSRRQSSALSSLGDQVMDDMDF